jgi:hypothetical protein
VLADCDLRRGLHAKRWFDSVGHYSREDVLAPLDGGGLGTAQDPVASGDDGQRPS